MIKKIYKCEEVFDFVLELSQNDFYASYPRRTTIKDIKEVIERAINSDNTNIVACYKENVLYGVCIYYWISENNYAQTDIFLIKDNYEEVAKEFISYISEQLPGYELFIGFPTNNKNANEYFEKNYECIESSFDTKLYNLQQPKSKKHDKVERITKSDFEEYAEFHDKFAIPSEMYFNSKNLLKDIERFRVFAYRQDEAIHGSIFVKVLQAKAVAEVFGLFIDKEYESNGIESILINDMLMQIYNEFGEIKTIYYFINEGCDAELNAALSAGFEIKDKYRCYKCIL